MTSTTGRGDKYLRKIEATKRLETKSKHIKALEQAIESHPDSAADQQASWSKSRASFYRVLARYKAENGE